MSEPEKDDAAPANESKPKKKGRGKFLLIAVLMFVSLMGGGAGAWWYFNQAAAENAEAAPEEAAEEPEEHGMITLSSFIANLADPGGRKYLRTTVIVLVPDEATAVAFDANKLAVTRVRSAVLELLITRTTMELATPEGRAALKQSIAETVKTVGRLDVRDVLFEEFIVQ